MVENTSVEKELLLTSDDFIFIISEIERLLEMIAKEHNDRWRRVMQMYGGGDQSPPPPEQEEAYRRCEPQRKMIEGHLKIIELPLKELMKDKDYRMIVAQIDLWARRDLILGATMENFLALAAIFDSLKRRAQNNTTFPYPIRLSHDIATTSQLTCLSLNKQRLTSEIACLQDKLSGLKKEVELNNDAKRHQERFVLGEGVDQLKQKPLEAAPFLKTEKDKNNTLFPENEAHKNEGAPHSRAEHKLRNNQRHKERCIAIALMKWQADKSLTIAALAENPDIIKIGCEGVKYTQKAIRDWIKKHCPDRSQGRRPS